MVWKQLLTQQINYAKSKLYIIGTGWKIRSRSNAPPYFCKSVLKAGWVCGAEQRAEAWKCWIYWGRKLIWSLTFLPSQWYLFANHSGFTVCFHGACEITENIGSACNLKHDKVIIHPPRTLQCACCRFVVSVILYLVHDTCLKPPETFHSWIKVVLCEIFLLYLYVKTRLQFNPILLSSATPHLYPLS